MSSRRKKEGQFRIINATSFINYQFFALGCGRKRHLKKQDRNWMDRILNFLLIKIAIKIVKYGWFSNHNILVEKTHAIYATAYK